MLNALRSKRHHSGYQRNHQERMDVLEDSACLHQAAASELKLSQASDQASGLGSHPTAVAAAHILSPDDVSPLPQRGAGHARASTTPTAAADAYIHCTVVRGDERDGKLLPHDAAAAAAHIKLSAKPAASRLLDLSGLDHEAPAAATRHATDAAATGVASTCRTTYDTIAPMLSHRSSEMMQSPASSLDTSDASSDGEGPSPRADPDSVQHPAAQRLSHLVNNQQHHDHSGAHHAGAPAPPHAASSTSGGTVGGADIGRDTVQLPLRRGRDQSDSGCDTFSRRDQMADIAGQALQQLLQPPRRRSRTKTGSPVVAPGLHRAQRRTTAHDLRLPAAAEPGASHRPALSAPPRASLAPPAATSTSAPPLPQQRHVAAAAAATAVISAAAQDTRDHPVRQRRQTADSAELERTLLTEDGADEDVPSRHHRRVTAPSASGTSSLTSRQRMAPEAGAAAACPTKGVPAVASKAAATSLHAGAPRAPARSVTVFVQQEECLPVVLRLGCCPVRLFEKDLTKHIEGLWRRLCADGTIPIASCFLCIGPKWVPLCVEDFEAVLSADQVARALPMIAETTWRTLAAQDKGLLGRSSGFPVLDQVLEWCRVLQDAITGLTAAVVAGRQFRSMSGFGWLSSRGGLTDVDARAERDLDTITETLLSVGAAYHRLPVLLAGLLARQRLVPLLCELLHCVRGPLCEVTYRLIPIFSRVLSLAHVLAKASPELLHLLTKPQRVADTTRELPALTHTVRVLRRRTEAFLDALAGALSAVGTAGGTLPDRMRTVYELVGSASRQLGEAEDGIQGAIGESNAARNAAAEASRLPGTDVNRASMASRRHPSPSGTRRRHTHACDGALSAAFVSEPLSYPGDVCPSPSAADHGDEYPYASRVEGVAGNVIGALRRKQGLPPGRGAPELANAAAGDGGRFPAAAVEAVVRWIAAKAEGVHGEIPTSADMTYLLGMQRHHLLHLERLVFEQCNWELYGSQKAHGERRTM